MLDVQDGMLEVDVSHMFSEVERYITSFKDCSSHACSLVLLVDGSFPKSLKSRKTSRSESRLIGSQITLIRLNTLLRAYLSKLISVRATPSTRTKATIQGLTGMAGRNRMTSRGPTIPAQEENQIWSETYNILKQLPDTHVKAQKIASEANKNQKILLALGNGEGNLFLYYVD